MEYIYAALLLHKLRKDITEENIKRVIEATGTQVDEAKVKTLVASLKGVDIEKVISEAAVGLAALTQAGGKEEAKAEPKEEKKEAAAEGLSALFG
jgi:large subunit ribosomal protein L12